MNDPLFVIGWLISILIGGLIGRVKQRPLAGVIYALLLGPLGWLIVAVVPGGGKKCPRCAETVKREAKVCKHCQADLSEPERPKKPAPEKPPRKIPVPVAAKPVDPNDPVEKWKRDHPPRV